MLAFQAYLANPNTRKVLSRKPGDKGFSLIELVVVVAVLAILAAIAIPAFTSINDKAAVSAAQNTLVQIVKECAVKKANGEALQFTPPNLNSYSVTPADGACSGSVTIPRVTCTAGQTVGADGKCDGVPQSDSKVTATRKEGSSAELPATISVSFATGQKDCSGGSTNSAPLAGFGSKRVRKGLATKLSYTTGIYEKPPKHNVEEGFSLLELVVVVTILSILAGIGIPIIGNIINQSKIDSVKASVNSAIADCLQKVRLGADPAVTIPSNSIISNDSLQSNGYKINENKCSSFFVSPSNPDEKYLYQLGFKISSNGDVVKIAVPSSDSGSLNSCKDWGGVNCGVSAEQQSIWDALARIEASKKACNDEFYAWLQKPSSGSYNRWDETSKSCSLVTWAFEGSIQKDEQAVKDARAAKLGALCTAKLKEKETSRYDGAFTDPECGTTYFCSGKDLATENKTAYDACKEQERQMKCTAALGAWKTKAINGQFNESGCTTMWQCNGQYLTTHADYDASSCGCTWVDEQYQTGTKMETQVIGTTMQKGTCKTSAFGQCLEYNQIPTPVYGQVSVPVYETRKVCKKP